MWKTIAAVLCACVAVGGVPVPEDPLVVLVGQDASQSVAVLNPEQQQRLVPIAFPQGHNVRYFSRNFAEDSYQFGYNTGKVAADTSDQYRHELRRQDGTVLGRYGYTDPEGVARVYNYVADQGGFRILQPGELVALDVEETPEDNPSKGRIEGEALADPISLPAIPEGAADLSQDPNTYSYILGIRQ